jgi:hypothetical protein
MKPYPDFRDLEHFSGITWGDLTALEPRLEELLWAARQAGVACRLWSDVDRAFAPVRNTLTDLVGFTGTNHRHPILGCCGAFQIAYWKLYDAVAASLPARASCAAKAPEKHRGRRLPTPVLLS